MNCCCFKIFFAVFLLLNSANFQENSSNNVQLLDGKIHKELADEMLSDDIGIQQGNDVKLMKPGSINLTLTFKKLEFQVCKHDCIGDAQVCYESLNGLSDTNAVGSCTGLSSCEFKVKNDEKHDTLLFGEVTHVPKDLFSGCLKSTMKYPTSFIIKSELSMPFDSCDPKINPVDEMIKLQVIHLSSCPIIVKNAKIHLPEVASTKPPSLSQNSNDSSSMASFPWWGILIIVFVILFAIVAVIFVVYCIFKKRQTSKLVPPSDVVPKTTVPNKNVATLETPSKRKVDLNFTKFEPSKKTQRKKAKKQTTQDPTTTEDAPAPVVTVPPAPILPPPAPAPTTPAPNNYYPPIPRVIPRSLKSVKTDSLDETTQKDKAEMVERMPLSLYHHCMQTSDTTALRQMQVNYPPVKYGVIESEVEMLCSPVSKMFTVVTSLTRDAEQKLTALGVEFDNDRCILTMTESARRFLQDAQTAATTVCFAFGAEYHEYLMDDADTLSKVSVPLLMAITLQPRFDVANRRKACSILRRKLPKILANFTAVKREKMAFPINIIEKAYCQNPKYFKIVAEIKTDSEGERKKELEAADVEKNEMIQKGRGKKRKKSSKKSH